jgi:catechol 2,3-dioxygenase-like lactoylglutathione lyase family enzyme
VESIYPFFIVADVAETAQYYRSKLGFEFFAPEQAAAQLEGDFAMLKRDGIVLMFKAVENGRPRPNHTVHPHATHDAFIHVRDPGRLCEELRAKGVRITKEVEQTEWNTREFHFADNNGYVFCCGHST